MTEYMVNAFFFTASGSHHGGQFVGVGCQRQWCIGLDLHFLVSLAARGITIFFAVSILQEVSVEIARRFIPLSVSAFPGADQPRSEVTPHFFYDFGSTRRDCALQKHGLADVALDALAWPCRRWDCSRRRFSVSGRLRATHLLFLMRRLSGSQASRSCTEDSRRNATCEGDRVQFEV